MHFALRIVRIAIVFSAAGIVAVRPLTAASVSRSEAARMPAVEVKGERGHFEFAIEYDDETNRVQKAKITWVSPAAYKSSLRVGDRVVSIDGKPIGEFLHDDAFHALRGKVKPGEVRTIVFTRIGLFKRINVTYTINGPNKAPEPTTMAVTPRATEGDSK